MLELLGSSQTTLREALSRHPLATDADALWAGLRRLLLANAPSGGCGLPGSILDDVAALVAALGLGDRFIRQLGSTGNAALWLGADKAQPDVVVISHIDRPSFRVRSVAEGTLYPICADRFPEGLYRVGAKALRFADGVLMVGARGTLISDKEAGRDSLRFETGSGTLAWYDTLTLDVEPTLTDGMVQGTGLDNCLGVLTMLAAAAALRSIEPALVEQNRRCLFVFSDQEEGIPEAYFGHGAARLTHAIPPPTFGCILADAHTVGANSNIVFGQGASHGNISAWSRGSVVPPNYLALALDLAEGINQIRPQTVQLNTGYLSRSDDMALGRWTQILGMIGAPMSDAHTGYERAHLADGQSAIWWLAHFTLATLALEPGLARRYAFVES